MNRYLPRSQTGLDSFEEPAFRTSDNADAAMERAILQLLDRRPRTVDDTAESFQLDRLDAVKHLDSLHRQGLVRRRRAGNRIFYYPA